MRYRFILLCGITALGLAACSSEMSAEQRAILEHSISRPITCKAGNDCKEKWDRTAQWLIDNSTQKIAIRSNSMIQTEPVYVEKYQTSYSAFTLTKRAAGKGNYVIEYSSVCDKQVQCKPSGLALKANFVRFVMGASYPTAALQQHITQMQLVMEEMKTANNECRKKRLSGELKTYQDSVTCSNPLILKIFERIHYPYMDLAQEFTAKRLELAILADQQQITEAQMQAELVKEVTHINSTEQARNISTTPSAVIRQ